MVVWGWREGSALRCTVSCYTVLYCTVLYCTVLYCTVLYCTVLYCTVLYCTVLYCTVLYCTVLYCTVLYCTVMCCTVPVLYNAVQEVTRMGAIMDRQPWQGSHWGPRVVQRGSVLCTLLYHIVLYCVHCCTILYCTVYTVVPYCTVLCTLLYHIVLYCVHCCTILYCTVYTLLLRPSPHPLRMSGPQPLVASEPQPYSSSIGRLYRVLQQKQAKNISFYGSSKTESRYYFWDSNSAPIESCFSE